jgi:hypothetical protein
MHQTTKEILERADAAIKKMSIITEQYSNDLKNIKPKAVEHIPAPETPEPQPLTPEEFYEIAKTDPERWAEVVDQIAKNY